jgi:pyruvate dehydrogenase E1 component alpha subunit
MSPFATHSPIANIADRAAAFGFDGVTVDGSDVLAVYDAVAAAVAKARAGLGPTLVEAKTHRWHGHYEGDPQRYVAAADRDLDQRRDPLPLFAARLGSAFGVTAAEIEASFAAAQATIQDAITFAQETQGPALTVMLDDVYA